MQAERPTITPDLKVSELLRQFPEVEETLIALSPEFKRLRNPVLRRTLARLATLRQVATIGGVPLGAMIGALRGAAGQADGPPVADPGADDAAAGARPDWATAAAVAQRFDARALIEDGGHPLERVMRDLAALAPGQVYELVTPFTPEPLKEVAAGKGFASFSAIDGPTTVRTWFHRA